MKYIGKERGVAKFRCVASPNQDPRVWHIHLSVECGELTSTYREEASLARDWSMHRQYTMLSRDLRSEFVKVFKDVYDELPMKIKVCLAREWFT